MVCDVSEGDGDLITFFTQTRRKEAHFSPGVQTPGARNRDNQQKAISSNPKTLVGAFSDPSSLKERKLESFRVIAFKVGNC